MLNLQKSDIRNKFKKVVPTRTQIAKHVFFAENIFVPKKGHIDMFSFTNNETVT